MFTNLEQAPLAKPRVGRREAFIAGALGALGAFVGLCTFLAIGSGTTGFGSAIAYTLPSGSACLILGYSYTIAIIGVRHPGNLKVKAALEGVNRKIYLTSLIPGIWLFLSVLLPDEILTGSLVLLIVIGLPMTSALFFTWISQRKFRLMLAWTFPFWLITAILVGISAVIFILPSILALAIAIFAHARLLERALGLTFVKSFSAEDD